MISCKLDIIIQIYYLLLLLSLCFRLKNLFNILIITLLKNINSLCRITNIFSKGRIINDINFAIVLPANRNNLTVCFTIKSPIRILYTIKIPAIQIRLYTLSSPLLNKYAAAIATIA